MLIVAGGDNVGGKSTEKFIIGGDGWTVVGTLPRSTFWISGATISMNNKIYIFGESIYVLTLIIMLWYLRWR